MTIFFKIISFLLFFSLSSCTQQFTLSTLSNSSSKADTTGKHDTYKISGLVRVNGGTLKFKLAGAEELSFSKSGTFEFTTQIKKGQPYSVALTETPNSQICGVKNGTGVASGDVQNIIVGCGASGRVTYDFVPTVFFNTTSTKLDYAEKFAKPARRVTVQLLRKGNVLSETATDDQGNFYFSDYTPPAQIRVLAQSTATLSQVDGIGDDYCNGAKWDFSVVDNNNALALYTMETTEFSDTAPILNVSVHAGLGWSYNGYTDRTAAPFSILDTVLQGAEFYCQNEPDADFTKLNIYWSLENQAGASFTKKFNLRDAYITLNGKEDVNTDEYDTPVILHELSHFFDNIFYRNDSFGGTHNWEIEDSRIVHSEGFATAMGNAILKNSKYTNVVGYRQSEGWSNNLEKEPVGDLRGIYGERSAQYLFYKLFLNRSYSWDRIHQTRKHFQIRDQSYTNLQSFAAYYNQQYGNSDGLAAIWESTLDTPYNSLCVGTCSKTTSDRADPFDVDNDIGNHYASTRKYKAGGSTQSAEFWRLYRTVSFGSNSPTAHDVINSGGYLSSDTNNLGMIRLYRYQPSIARTENITINAPSGRTCAEDVMDLRISDFATNTTLENFTLTGTQAGCPCKAFNVSNSLSPIVFAVKGKLETGSFNITVGSGNCSP